MFFLGFCSVIFIILILMVVPSKTDEGAEEDSLNNYTLNQLIIFLMIGLFIGLLAMDVSVKRGWWIVDPLPSQNEPER